MKNKLNLIFQAFLNVGLAYIIVHYSAKLEGSSLVVFIVIVGLFLGYLLAKKKETDNHYHKNVRIQCCILSAYGRLSDILVNKTHPDNFTDESYEYIEGYTRAVTDIYKEIQSDIKHLDELYPINKYQENKNQEVEK